MEKISVIQLAKLQVKLIVDFFLKHLLVLVDIQEVHLVLVKHIIRIVQSVVAQNIILGQHGPIIKDVVLVIWKTKNVKKKLDGEKDKEYEK